LQERVKNRKNDSSKFSAKSNAALRAPAELPELLEVVKYSSAFLKSPSLAAASALKKKVFADENYVKSIAECHTCCRTIV
jgi:hypothetical protein